MYGAGLRMPRCVFFLVGALSSRECAGGRVRYDTGRDGAVVKGRRLSLGVCGVF
jgi:hypothetical protein